MKAIQFPHPLLLVLLNPTLLLLVFASIIIRPKEQSLSAVIVQLE
jgi:hypothetical protein